MKRPSPNDDDSGSATKRICLDGLDSLLTESHDDMFSNEYNPKNDYKNDYKNEYKNDFKNDYKNDFKNEYNSKRNSILSKNSNAMLGSSYLNNSSLDDPLPIEHQSSRIIGGGMGGGGTSNNNGMIGGMGGGSGIDCTDMSYMTNSGSNRGSNNHNSNNNNNDEFLTSFDSSGGSGGGGTSNLWERKCAILEEEVSIWKKQFQVLRRRLGQETHLRKKEEVEVKGKIETIHSLQNVIDREKDQQIGIIQQQLEEETKMRIECEEKVRRQQIEINNLLAGKGSNSNNKSGERGSEEIEDSGSNGVSSSTINDDNISKDSVCNNKRKNNGGSGKADCTDMTILRKEVIQSRKRQLALFRKIDEYKTRNADLEHQLLEQDGIDSPDFA